MNLGKSDWKLLTLLYQSKREPITKIAKACRLTREQVHYKLNKYISSGLIKSFFTLVDYSKFGHSYFMSILLKFDTLTSANGFMKNLPNSKNCISWGRIFSKYDLYINCIFSDEKEANQYMETVLSDKICPVVDFAVIKPYLFELYPLKFIHNTMNIPMTVIGSPAAKRSFDKKEIEILKILATDGRARIVDIAHKLKISSELALYKVRRLYADNVILGTRIQFNMGLSGYYFSIIFLDIKHLSKEIKNKLHQFARTSPNVNIFALSFSKPNCVIQIFHKEVDELRTALEDVKGLLKDEQVSIEVILVKEDEVKINTLPFL